jgi:transcription initiation factor TFIIIB Brf1 subunit/transcription initiation factor TFIIB
MVHRGIFLTPTPLVLIYCGTCCLVIDRQRYGSGLHPRSPDSVKSQESRVKSAPNLGHLIHTNGSSAQREVSRGDRVRAV